MKVVMVSETSGPLLVTITDSRLATQQFKLEGTNAKRVFLKMLGKYSRRETVNNGYYYSIVYWVD